MDLAALARSLRLPKATAPSRSSTFKSFLAATRSSKDFLELKGNSFELFGTQRGVKPPNNQLEGLLGKFHQQIRLPCWLGRNLQALEGRIQATVPAENHEAGPGTHLGCACPANSKSRLKPKRVPRAIPPSRVGSEVGAGASAQRRPAHGDIFVGVHADQ